MGFCTDIFVTLIGSCLLHVEKLLHCCGFCISFQLNLYLANTLEGLEFPEPGVGL